MQFKILKINLGKSRKSYGMQNIKTMMGDIKESKTCVCN